MRHLANHVAQYTPRHTNYIRAMANWQRKSEHLLRENVKFQTYVDSLTAAQKARDKFYERKRLREAAAAPIDSTEQDTGFGEVLVQQ